MDDLIQALQIFRKYTNTRWPTHCEHDVMYIMEVKEVEQEDRTKLKALGFEYDEEDSGWYSFRFGSA